VLAEKENEIADKLESIEFPSGKIPVGLKEAIAIFPILLAGGSLVVTSLLARCIKLRQELHKSRMEEECKQGKFDIQRLVLLFRLWIDPADRFEVIVIKIVIFIIPLLGFIASWYYIQELALLDTFVDNRLFGYDRGIYLRILYLALILPIGYGYIGMLWRLIEYALFYKKNQRCPQAPPKNALKLSSQNLESQYDS
jgi:hypothetical protein